MTHLQVKNKWDHLRKLWKQYVECFDNETRLGIDVGIGMLKASDDWWTQKIELTLHNCEKFYCLKLYCVLTTGCPHVDMS